MNKVILIENVGKDPEVHTFESGDKVASFSLATNESYKNKDGERVDATEWHNVKISGKMAEVAEKWLTKGKQIAIDGKIKTRKYESNGEAKYITEIHARGFDFIGNKAEAPAPQPKEPELSNGLPEDDLPF